ncbi:MAG TPA: S8 family peptidase [Candidatus Deferrimicrobium sp.]|nr:S8 family peptidase [Candidatus Deferrimicrobium sp.]
MRLKTKGLAALIIFLLLNFWVPLSIFRIIQKESTKNNSVSYKLMFDESVFKNKSNRVIINFERGVDIYQAKQAIMEICEGGSEPLEFDFISAICCIVTEEELYQIANLNGVQKIYLDEQVKLDILTPDPLSYNEIFQFEQCANQTGSRLVPATGNGVNISIIDTGIDFSHVDLTGKMLAQTSFVKVAYGFDADKEENEVDYNGHGTHCAGIATGTGAASPAGYNLTGIAPQAKLLNAKCLDQFGSGYLSGVIAAINWSIAHNAAIISMSLGFLSNDPDYPLSKAVDNATKQGIVVVAAAGNSGPFFSTVDSPGSSRLGITVGANDKNGKITDFSSRGPTSVGFVDPDVVAPGKNVMSPIAKNSILEALGKLEDFYIQGENDNGYAILSGTSMATPMVAGMAALLLDAFPTLNPYMIRTALMKGADSLGYSPNIEGAGRINGNSSYYHLLNSAPIFNITTVLPTHLPIPPFDNSLFPGTSYMNEILILSGTAIDMRVECTGPISPYVRLQNTTNNELPVNDILLYIKSQEAYFTDLQVEFNFPLSITPMNYNGTLIIRDNITNQILEIIELSANITSPRGRIYFDRFHNVDTADSLLSNYHNFSLLLSTERMQITYGSSLLSFPLLSQYDLVILPDIELPLTPTEIAALHKYWEMGGNLLILSSSYPYTAIESINQLLQRLDVGMIYTKTNIEDSYDIGLDTYLTDFLITNISHHPITEGVTQFSWLNGVALSINLSKALPVASYSGSPVLGVSNQSTAHRLVCMGSERLFYDDFISRSYNQKLVSQIITWLLNGSLRSQSEDLRVEVQVDTPILELDRGNTTGIAFYVSDPSTHEFINNLVPHINLSCIISHYDAGTWTPIWDGNASNILGLGNGAYYFNFSSFLEGIFLVNITIKNLSNLQNGLGISYFNYTSNLPIIIFSIITTTIPNEQFDKYFAPELYRQVDSLTINVTLRDTDTISNIRNVTCYISSLDTYRSDIKYLTLEMTNTTPTNGVEANFSLTLSPDYNYPAGSYAIFFEILDSNGYSDYSSSLLEFYIEDHYPTINNQLSKLKGTSFQGLQYTLTTIECGKSFSVEITGNDNESILSSMHAYVIIFNTFTIGLYLYLYEALWGIEVPFTGSIFSEVLTLPSNCLSQILEDTYTLNGRLILMVLLLDSDGQFDEDSYAFAQINVPTPFPLPLVVIIITVVGGCISAIVLYSLFKRPKNQHVSNLQDNYEWM